MRQCECVRVRNLVYRMDSAHPILLRHPINGTLVQPCPEIILEIVRVLKVEDIPSSWRKVIAEFRKSILRAPHHRAGVMGKMFDLEILMNRIRITDA
jgi:hypothetical protein